MDPFNHSYAKPNVRISKKTNMIKKPKNPVKVIYITQGYKNIISISNIKNKIEKIKNWTLKLNFELPNDSKPHS